MSSNLMKKAENMNTVKPNNFFIIGGICITFKAKKLHCKSKRI